ncbi:cytochrome c maturation protein CcmE [Candidatus Bathyarchaeota archaeon]|nr:cytochrome c maturation protein CcmE [Candidatus Bathyarchaeota archaeon]
MKLYKILALGAILLVAGYLIYQASTSVMNPYLSVSEVKQHPDRYVGRDIQLIGNVTRLEGGNSGLSFTLIDDSASVKVSYFGPIPQNFMEGIRIVVIGRLNPDGSFAARQILTKCPSKYAA